MKIGPGRNSKRPSRWSKRKLPVMSLGRRSGVNWIRLKLSSSVWATSRAMSVLASPG